jgi:hypothetical protein
LSGSWGGKEESTFRFPCNPNSWAGFVFELLASLSPSACSDGGWSQAPFSSNAKMEGWMNMQSAVRDGGYGGRIEKLWE